MQRTLTLNDYEPVPLSLRVPLGIELTLDLLLRDRANEPVNPDNVRPQLMLTARTGGTIFGYDMETYDAVNGIARAFIPGGALTDRNGYALELYARRAAVEPTDPPVPMAMMARGVVVLDGLAYTQLGPFANIPVPVVVGPAGPPGPTGPRGSVWTTGVGAPSITGGEANGDMYLDEASGDVWRFDGGIWTMGTFTP